MSKYESSGDVKQKNFFLRTSVIILILGAVMLIVGLVLIKKDGLDKYVKKYSAEETVEGAEITELDISVGAVTLNIGKSDDDDFHIVAKDIPYKLYHKVERKRLFIYSDDDQIITINTLMASIGKDRLKGTLEILIPDKEYNYIEMDCGLADATISGVKCNKFDLDCGISDVEFKEFFCKEADMDFGMSDVEFDSGSLGKSNIDLGMSDFDFKGYVTDDMNIDVGMSSAVLKIYGDRSDYNLKGDAEASGENNDKGIKIKGDTGMGDLDISFESVKM